MLKKGVKKIKSIAIKRFFVDIGSISNTVFLAGTGRSGTTWLQNIINCNNDFRIMFEPFHNKKVDCLKKWKYRQYIRPTNSSTKYLNPAEKILTGNIKNPWIDKFNSRWLSRNRLIKDVRSNLFLKWLKNHFPHVPIVLIMRHPCAVANSKLKLNWDTHIDNLLSQPNLIEDHLSPFLPKLKTAESTLEKHILLWCVENYLPLKQFEPGEIHIVFYENLCLNPEEEISKLSNFLDLNLLPEALKLIDIPSELTREESAINNDKNLISSWKNKLSPTQIEESLNILSYFGMDIIYNESPTPLMDAKTISKKFMT